MRARQRRRPKEWCIVRIRKMTHVCMTHVPQIDFSRQSKSKHFLSKSYCFSLEFLKFASPDRSGRLDVWEKASRVFPRQYRGPRKEENVLQHQLQEAEDAVKLGNNFSSLHFTCQKKTIVGCGAKQTGNVRRTQNIGLL